MTGSLADQLVADLDSALRERLRVHRVDTVEAFIAPGETPRYLLKPRLTVALHFDIEPAFLIFDPAMGTLGIVELAGPIENGHDAKEIAQLVHRCIDKATYLRHLMLRDRDQGNRRALTVELVLLSADHTDAQKEGLDAIGTALREALRDTHSLFHVGVGVLCHGVEKDPFAGRLRRAFPWLLTATRRWLASARAIVGTPNGPPPRLKRLTLENYRLPGVRELTFAKARVHLIHGPNGSGKSSIAEALELLTSGKVERLQQADAGDYVGVIKSTRSDGEAKIEIHRDSTSPGGEKRQWVVVDTGVAKPLDPSVHASSFRLDQPLMEQLVGKFPHERARSFLQAFFPDAVKSRVAYEQAMEPHKQALSKVQRVADRLRAAREALLELQNWKSGASAHAKAEFPVVLNRWLEHTVLLDLMQRARTVQETLSHASGAGWSSSASAAAALVGFAGAVDGNRLASLEHEYKESVDDLHAQLESFKPVVPPATPHPGDAKQVSPLSVDALNFVSSFLFTSTELQAYGLFGDKLSDVVNAGDAPTYGSTVIGADKWAAPIIKEIDALLSACAALSGDAPVTSAWPGKSPCAEYDEARTTHANYLASGRDLTDRFVEKLRPDQGTDGEFDGSLIAAVNELMALFTPARWAYEDIRLPPTIGDGKVGLPIQLGNGERNVRAELHLNTAELNLFTVALFLLCSSRVHKPLNLLVFDDPLQNMDELTSTALARGITKVVRLWASLERPMELLFLFHGEDDLERFRAELDAATYRLPWLSPGPSPAPVHVQADGVDSNVLAVQDLKGMALRMSD